MATTYVSQWEVPSNSDPTKKPYKVSLTEGGEYQCSCMAWTRHMPRRDCSHITQVKANPDLYEKGGPMVPPTIIQANVVEVTQMPHNELYTPLLPLDGAAVPFTVTVLYDLLKFGVPWGVIKKRYDGCIYEDRGDAQHCYNTHGIGHAYPNMPSVLKRKKPLIHIGVCRVDQLDKKLVNEWT